MSHQDNVVPFGTPASGKHGVRFRLPDYQLTREVAGITVEAYSNVDPTSLPAYLLVSAIFVRDLERALEDEQAELDAQIRQRAGDWFHMLLAQSGSAELCRGYFASGAGNKLCPFENVLFVNGSFSVGEALRSAAEMVPDAHGKTLVLPTRQFFRPPVRLPIAAAFNNMLPAVQFVADRTPLPFGKIKLVF